MDMDAVKRDLQAKLDAIGMSIGSSPTAPVEATTDKQKMVQGSRVSKVDMRVKPLEDFHNYWYNRIASQYGSQAADIWSGKWYGQLTRISPKLDGAEYLKIATSKPMLEQSVILAQQTFKNQTGQPGAWQLKTDGLQNADMAKLGPMTAPRGDIMPQVTPTLPPSGQSETLSLRDQKAINMKRDFYNHGGYKVLAGMQVASMLPYLANYYMTPKDQRPGVIEGMYQAAGVPYQKPEDMYL